jgi:hypothetical protein
MRLKKSVKTWKPLCINTLPMEKHTIRDEMEALAPGLQERIGRETPLPPQGYFTELQEKVLRSASAGPPAPARRGRIMTLPGLVWWRSIAAAFLVIGLLSWWHLRPADQNGFTALPSETLNYYLESELSELDETLLLDDGDVVTGNFSLFSLFESEDWDHFWEENPEMLDEFHSEDFL